jgi:glucose-1-phosphate thymidylyltransferase
VGKVPTRGKIKDVKEYRPIGIVPAAGLGKRLGRIQYPKELLPVGYTPCPGGLRPQLVCEHALAILARAGATKVVMIVSPAKLELLKYLGTGSEFGVSLAFVEQPAPFGLADAIVRGLAWADGRDILLALPDTVIRPLTALKTVYSRLASTRSDVCLGVFPTRQPERFAPVETDADGRVRRVTEKPPTPSCENTWGIAAWTERFSTFLRENVEPRGSGTPAGCDTPGKSISAAFDKGAAAGLKVQSAFFPAGRFSDIGTFDGLADLMSDIFPFEAGPALEACRLDDSGD